MQKLNKNQTVVVCTLTQRLVRCYLSEGRSQAVRELGVAVLTLTMSRPRLLKQR